MIEEKEEIEEMLRVNEKLFTGFLILRGICIQKRKRKLNTEEAHFIYENYSFLLTERKNYLETEKKLKALNGFYGLR